MREREREESSLIISSIKPALKELKNSHLIFNFQNLLKAYYQCRKRKRKTANATKFEFNFEGELFKLEQELINHNYKPSRSICFVIVNHKSREVFAADFRDRIVHHLLINYLQPIWEKKFIYHSYSCRNNKGPLCAFKNLKKAIKCVSKNFSVPAYYLQLDISAFFMSLNKNILLEIIKRHIKNPEIIWLTEKIISQDPTENFHKKGNIKLFDSIPPNKSLFKIPKNQGLPIGNLTSQFFANVYLNELDQFIKHKLKIKYYMRYVDDLIILNQSPKQLLAWRKEISNFLKINLKLKLHPQKQLLQPIYRGINFIGFIVKPKYCLARNRNVKKLKNKLYCFNKKILHLNVEHPIRLWTPELLCEFKKIFATINSYYGHLKHANTFKIRKHLYKKHFGILKIYLLPADKNYNYFIWAKD